MPVPPAKFALILGAVLLAGMVSASINPMLALYLVREARATPGELGGVLAAFNIAGMIASLTLGYLADRYHLLRQFFVLTALTGAACYAVLAASPSLAVVTLALVLLGGPGLAFISHMFALLRGAGLPDHQLTYTRAAFSLSWVIGPALGAFLVHGYGFGALFVVAAVIAPVALAAVLALLPGAGRPAPAPRSDAPVARPAASPLGLVAAVVVSFVCLQAVNSATVSYLPILVTEQRGESLQWPGVALGLCAALEVVALWLLGRYRNFGLSKATMVGIGAGAGALYALGLAVFDGVAALLALQVLNAVFIAAVMGVGMAWFQDLAAGRLGLMTAIYMNTSRLGAVVAAGLLGTQQVALPSWLGGIFGPDAAGGGVGLVPLLLAVVLGVAGWVGVLAVRRASARP
ncbi:MFS transporter [Micrococcales bacterium 31B]|nr:MFS transporter [Micrococcales bacterium 31B]